MAFYRRGRGRAYGAAFRRPYGGLRSRRSYGYRGRRFPSSRTRYTTRRVRFGGRRW